MIDNTLSPLTQSAPHGVRRGEMSLNNEQLSGLFNMFSALLHNNASSSNVGNTSAANASSSTSTTQGSGGHPAADWLNFLSQAQAAVNRAATDTTSTATLPDAIGETRQGYPFYDVSTNAWNERPEAAQDGLSWVYDTSEKMWMAMADGDVGEAAGDYGDMGDGYYTTPEAITDPAMQEALGLIDPSASGGGSSALSDAVGETRQGFPYYAVSANAWNERPDALDGLSWVYDSTEKMWVAMADGDVGNTTGEGGDLGGGYYSTPELITDADLLASLGLESSTDSGGTDSGGTDGGTDAGTGTTAEVSNQIIGRSPSGYYYYSAVSNPDKTIDPDAPSNKPTTEVDGKSWLFEMQTRRWLLVDSWQRGVMGNGDQG